MTEDIRQSGFREEGDVQKHVLRHLLSCLVYVF